MPRVEVPLIKILNQIEILRVTDAVFQTFLMRRLEILALQVRALQIARGYFNGLQCFTN